MSATSPAILPPPPSVADVIKHRRPLLNTHKEVLEHITPLDRLALWITVHVGSMGFFLTIFGWTVCWLGWNVLTPQAWQFDPPMAFVFWLFISNVIQILLMPLIMVGQNLQSRHGEARAENDLQVNIRAEKEIEVSLAHPDYKTKMLVAMVKNLGGNTDARSRTRKP